MFVSVLPLSSRCEVEGGQVEVRMRPVREAKKARGLLFGHAVFII
jgi:hypothetical protein